MTPSCGSNPRKARKLPKALTKDELGAVFKAGSSTRGKLTLEILLDSGIRLPELAGLDKNDVDTKSCVIKVFGKGGKERHAFITNETALSSDTYCVFERPREPVKEDRLLLTYDGYVHGANLEYARRTLGFCLLNLCLFPGPIWALSRLMPLNNIFAPILHIGRHHLSHSRSFAQYLNNVCHLLLQPPPHLYYISCPWLQQISVGGHPAALSKIVCHIRPLVNMRFISFFKCSIVKGLAI